MLVVIAVSVPLTITLLLSDRAIQSYAVNKATSMLSEKLGVRVSIGSIEYQIPATISFNDLFIEDQNQDTLGYIGSFYASVKIIPLFEKKIVVRAIKLDKANIELKIDSTGRSNLQFIIDAFATPDTTPLSFDFVIQADEIALSNCQFSLDQINKPYLNNKFDPNHLQFYDLTTSIGISHASQDSAFVVIEDFTVKEESGLNVCNLSSKGWFGNSGASINGLQIELPASKVDIENLSLQIDSLPQLFIPQELYEHGIIDLNINPSYINGNDLAFLEPKLSKLNHNIEFSTELQCSANSIDLVNLSANYGPNVNIMANASINDPFNPDQTFVFADIHQVELDPNDISSIIYEFSDHKTNIKETLKQLGQTTFTGNVTGYFSDLVAYGTLNTDAGIANTDIMLSYDADKKSIWFKGDVNTPQFAIGRFIPNSKLGNISADLTIDGGKKGKQKINGNIAGNINFIEYNDYTFEDIDINGIYNSEEASAKVEYYDKQGNGDIYIDAHIDYRNATKIIDIQAYIDSINPHEMHLIEKYENLQASIMLGSHLEITGADKIDGWIAIDSLILNNANRKYILDELVITPHIKGHNSCIDIKSDLINGHLDGELTPSLIVNNIQSIIAKQLTNYAPIQTKKNKSGNNFDFKIKINPIDEIADVLNLSVSLDDTTYISGAFNDHKDEIELQILGNSIELEKMSIDSVLISLYNHKDNIYLKTKAAIQPTGDTIHLKTTSELSNNLFTFESSLHNHAQLKYDGNFTTSVKFKKPQIANTNLNIDCNINQSSITIGSATWNIKQSEIEYDEITLKVDSFDITSEKQFVRIDGQASKDPQKDDSLMVELKNFDMDYLSSLLPMKDPSFVGLVTGNVTAANIFSKPRLKADLFVEQFGLNDYSLGDVDAHAAYNLEKEQIDIHGMVYNGNILDTTRIEGFVSPAHNEMLLEIDFKDLNLRLLKRYLAVFADDMDATASGKLYVGGLLNKGIDVWGAAYVHDAFISVDFLKTKYTFADSVKLEKDKILLENIVITDTYGNKGIVNGTLTHNHFQNFKYYIDIAVNNVLVMNTTEEDLPEFYGKIFADGNAIISGNDGTTNILVSARPTKNSYFAVPLETTNNASDNEFIRFVSKNDNATKTKRRDRRKRIINAPSAKLNVDISVEATPDLEAQIIINSHTGDIIKGRGNGNIKVNIDNNSNIKLYGRYTLIEGDYNFSLEGAIRKKFEVVPGSYIAFDGDPMSGILNIDAMYQTTASLTDLLEESMLTDVKNRMQKVNCLAYLRGNLQEPKVSFGIELPNADDEIQRRVKATINTEDLMSQQIVFLLLFSKFYNPQVTNRSASGTSMAASFATATLSSQLNYWISQISDAVNLGVNYQEDSQDAENNHTFEVNISTNLLDNRLLINGNLGYRTQYGTEDFIGDFDVEYKLNRSGRLRLKAYNQTNDKLYSTALYTQGLGIMYKETFDTWTNLGKTYKEAFRKKTPEEKEKRAEEKRIEKAQAEERKAAKRALREDRKRRHREYVEQQKALKGK